MKGELLHATGCPTCLRGLDALKAAALHADPGLGMVVPTAVAGDIKGSTA